MRLYEWRCKLDGQRLTVSFYAEWMNCPMCGSYMVRVYSIGIKKSMPDHYNASVGTYVRNEGHFRDELKKASEAASARTGMEHRFVPIDPRDKAAYGVSDEGMENTFRQQYDSGQAEKKLIL